MLSHVSQALHFDAQGPIREPSREPSSASSADDACEALRSILQASNAYQRAISICEVFLENLSDRRIADVLRCQRALEERCAQLEFIMARKRAPPPSMTAFKWEPGKEECRQLFGCESSQIVLEDSILIPVLFPATCEGIRSPCKSILLYGPPGTGKTSMVRNLSSKYHLPLLVIHPSHVVSKWSGDSERNLKQVFLAARSRKGRCIIFFDEIDGLCMQRRNSEHDERGSRLFLSEFLQQFNNLLSNRQSNEILVIGATNRIQDVDEAMLRRFEQKINIGYANSDARKRQIEHHLKTVSKLSGSELDDLSQKLVGWSGADIEILCRQAALLPLQEVVSTLRIAGHFEEKSSIEELKAVSDAEIRQVSYADICECIQLAKK